MALNGSTNDEMIWNYLVGSGMNAFGAAGLMGNLYAESGLNPMNLENLCEKRLREAGKPYSTDVLYTAAVDSGRITREEFIHPLPGKQYGYGLAQWTSAKRKSGLYDLAKTKGVSIGDLEMQLDFLKRELSSSYKSVLATLRTAKSVREASDAVLIKFEAPANRGEAVRAKRAEYGQKYYNNFSKSAPVVDGSADVRSERGKSMTESQARQKIVGFMRGWVGLKRSNRSHAPIIDTYNGRRPLPRGYEVKYTDEYCATTVSAAAIKAGYTDIVPIECSCYYLIEKAKAMGIWQENDAYIPDPGDEVLYDWNDGPNYATTDCKGVPKHVGMVESVKGTNIVVIEGNISGGIVGRRDLQVNGRYIRGFICPNYASKTTGKEPRKSVDVIALEVLAGKWGNGSDRKQKLEAAGYDYAAVQDAVNQKSKGEGSAKKSVSEVAQEVLHGKWGNNPARKKALETAGYDYSAVQAAVNRLCGK